MNLSPRTPSVLLTHRAGLRLGLLARAFSLRDRLRVHVADGLFFGPF